MLVRLHTSVYVNTIVINHTSIFTIDAMPSNLDCGEIINQLYWRSQIQYRFYVLLMGKHVC